MYHLTRLFLFLGIIGISLGTLTAQRDQAGFISGAFKPYPGEGLDAFDLREKKTEGSTYWQDDWLEGAVKMKSGQVVKGYPLKYDLANEGVDLQAVGDIKFIPAMEIEEFTLVDVKGTHRFINASNYFGLTDQSGSGFFEMLVEGDVALLLKMNLEVQKGNYVAALDAGDQTDRIIQKPAYYLRDGNDLLILPKKKKKRMARLEEYMPDIEALLKEEKLSLKKQDDLVTLINMINEEAGE